MYLVDFPNSQDRLDTPSTPFSETYDVVSPIGAPSEFYPNLSEISGSNDYDDFTVQGASIKDASEVGDDEDYEDCYDEDEDQDSEDDYWRLCPNEQVNQYGMSTIQRTSMGLLEQISRLQEELGMSTIENEETETTEEEVEEQIDLMKGKFPIAPGIEDVEVFLPDIDAMMQNHIDDDDELEMPQSVADASDVADLEDIAIKLRHASLGEEDRDLDYMTIEEFQMISGGLTSKSSIESKTSLPPPEVLLPSVPTSPGLLRNSLCQSSDNDSWDNDAEDSDDNIREDGEVNGHSFYIHGMTNGSGFDGSFERTLPGPFIGEVAFNSLQSDANTVQGNSGSNVIGGKTVAMMSEDSVPFIMPNDLFGYSHNHGDVITESDIAEGKTVSKEKRNGETKVNNVDCDNVMTKNNCDSIKTNGQELDNVEQPRSISEKINCLNAALAQDWGMKTNSKKRSLIKTFRKSLQRKNLTDSDKTDSNCNSNSGESVVADSVLTIFEALKTFEERSHQVQKKKTQLKRKLSSVETHLDRASNVIKSGDVTSASHSCHLSTSIDSKSESETVTSKPVDNLTKTQKHFPTGIANDVTQPLLPPEQLSLNQENGMGHLVRSKVNGVCDQEEGELNGVDGLDQAPSSPMDEDETDQHEQCYYAAVNRSSEDEVNDVNTDAIQDREYAEPTFRGDPNHGYAEPQTHCPVVKEESIYNPATDCVVDSHCAIVDEEEKTKPIITVDTIPNKTEVVDKSGLADTSSSSSQNRKSDNIYEIITPMEIKPEYAEIKKEVPLDVCENDTKICQSVTKEEIPLDSPDLIKTLPDVPLKSKPLVFQKREEKMEQKKVEVAKKNEVEVVRNLLPSEIKKQQVGPKGLKVNRSNLNKPNTVSPPKPAQTPPQNSVTSSNIEVVHRPPGSRRARIINSYLELERIKREGVNQSDGKPIQISAPNMALMSKMKGAGGGLRGSDEMLEDMINLQLMQAMGVNPHTIATPPVDKTSKSTPPQRPSHLPIPTPIKTTKPLSKQPASRHQTLGPSHGIAKMLNRFGESSAPTPKPGFQGFHSSGKTGATPVSKGLKKPPAFNIDIKDGELEVNIKDDNRQLLMNKLGVHSRGKGLSLPRTSNNSPSYNNNSSNTNSNNSRGLATTQGFESSIKPDGAIILKNHGVREEEEESSGKPANVRRTNAETKETPLVVADDSRRAKKEEKGKPVTGETSDERPSSESSSSPQTSLASFKECSGKDEDRVASTSEERVSVSNGNQYGGDVSEEHEIVEALSVPVSPSNLPSSSSSSPSSPSSSASPSSSSPPSSPPPPPQPSSINASPLSSQSFNLPEPRDDRDSVEKESVKPQESNSSDTEIDSEKVRCEIPNQDECGPESIPGPVLENIEMDADDEASKCDNIQTTKQAKPIPAVRKTKPETKPSQTSSSPSSSSASSSSSGASSSGSSSELDEVTGQPKEKRKHIGLKEAMRRRAQLKATELAKQSTKEVKKVESEETCTQEEPPSVSKAVNNATKDETEKIDRTIDGDTKNSDDSLVSKTTENLAVESTLEVKDVGDVKASRKQDDGSATKEEQKEGDEETSSSQSPVSSLSLSYTESEKVEAPSEDKSVSNDADSISKVKDTTGTVSPKISMTLHSPVTSTTTFPISNSTSPSTSTSENISSVIEVTPKMSERVQSTSQSLSTSSGSQSQKVNSSASEDSHDGAVLSVDKTNSSEHTPIRSSPDTSTTPSIPKNFGHPFRFHKTRDDNAIPTPKKTTTSVKRSESAVSSLQAKRNKFLNNRPRPDDDTSPTSSTPARSFKNVVSGSKFAALREKFSASNGNSNNNAGQGKHGGHSPSPSTTPKSLWQQKSPSSSSRFGGSISEESSPNTSEQKKSIYGTPPSSPPTPLPYMTPPESPLDFKGKTSTPLASSTPTGAAELKSPTAAELKRQFLFGRDDSQQGDVFVDEKGAKDEVSDITFLNPSIFKINNMMREKKKEDD
ncbi:uncharacterized protein LOC129253691 isoform X1 [Lytechinus pictus]|uniref:uncharacterized protein LOC129253691 isoform X1 n=1 Tax=Lytechinus pictus TaxID=7653 RepID=UPI0030B9CB80